MYILTIEANQKKTALESNIRSIDDANKPNEYYRYLHCYCIDMVILIFNRSKTISISAQ